MMKQTLKWYSKLTRKGKLMACKILFSFSVCSTCFSFTTCQIKQEWPLRRRNEEEKAEKKDLLSESLIYELILIF